MKVRIVNELLSVPYKVRVLKVFLSTSLVLFCTITGFLGIQALCLAGGARVGVRRFNNILGH